VSAAALPTVVGRRPRSRVPVPAALGLALAVLLVAYLSLAGEPLPPDQAVLALAGAASDPLAAFSVVELRLPRAVAAIAVGAMLALAGTLLQAVVRNPLASPELTGVSAGAVLAAVAWLGVVGGAAGDVDVTVPLVATVGGLLSGAFVYAVARTRGRTDPLRLVLTGVLVAGILSTVTLLLILVVRRDPDDDAFLTWLVGSLELRSWADVRVLVPYLLAALPLLALAIPIANVLQLGDGVAGGLGMPGERARILVLGTAVLLTAGAVSIAGAVGFVGLIAPHVARLLVGGDARRLAPVAALCGALVLLGADLVAAATPRGVPVGVFTAALGVPLFLHLLRRSA
jgi:iron complex transport system permease protein